MSTNNKKVGKVLGWSAIDRASNQGLQFVITFLMARQLFPTDYGLVAMLTVFIVLAEVFVDSGFSQALIQKQDRTQRDFSTVFYFNIVVAAVVYGILVLSGPLIAAYYNQPMLSQLIVWIGLNLVINSFSTVQVAKLSIALDFKRQALASIPAGVTSGVVGVWMAYAGYGVWALVAQTLCRNSLNTILLWILGRWWPSWTFSFTSFKVYFKFGSKLLGASLLHRLYSSIYTLVIGKWFQAKDLGLFGRAQQISQFPGNFMLLFERVCYPVLCQAQKDLEEVTEKFYSFVKMMGMVIFPLMFFIIAVSEPLVRVLLTDKWLEVVPLIRILCLSDMWTTFNRLNGSLVTALGRTDYFFRAEFVKKMTGIALLFASLPFGIQGVCWGLVLYAILDMAIMTYYTRRLAPQVSFMREMRILSPIIIMAALVSLPAYGLTLIIESPLLQLAAGLAASALVYVALAKWFYKEEFAGILKFL